MVRVHKRPPRRGLETFGVTDLVGPYLREGLLLRATVISRGRHLREGLRRHGPYRYAHGPVVARTRDQARAAGLLGAVAQLVERLLCKEEVRSSSLLGSTATTRWQSAAIWPYDSKSAPVFRRLEGDADPKQLPLVCSSPRMFT